MKFKALIVILILYSTFNIPILRPGFSCILIHGQLIYILVQALEESIV